MDNKNPPTPTPINTLVYSRSGHRAKYICSVAGRYGCEHYVKPEVEFGLPDGDIDSSFEGAAVWHEYFLSPPREVIDKEIATLQTKADTLRAEVQKLTREHAETKKEIEKDLEARKARLARHEQLKQLDDFIAKGVACYVRDDGYGEVTIVDFKDATCEYSSRNTFRLLSLFGGSNGQLDWKLNRYSDGSGSHVDCIPCVSKEDAPVAIAGLLSRRWDSWRKEGKGRIFSYAQVAQQHGIPIPEDVLVQIAKDTAETKQKNLERAEKAFVDAQAALMKAQEGLVDRTGVPAKPVACAAVPKSP